MILNRIKHPQVSATSKFKFGIQLGYGTNLPKTTFRTKIGRGSGQGSIPKKFGTPYVFLQPLKLATSNLVVHNLNFGSMLPKATFNTKVGRGLG